MDNDLDLEDDVGEVEFEEEASEEENNVGGVDVVIKTKKARVAKFSKDQVQHARSMYRSTLVCNIAHVVFGESRAQYCNDDGGAFPGFSSLQAVLQKRFKAEIQAAQTELEVFVRLVAIVRRWGLDCRLVFAPSFFSWKPDAALDEEAHPVYWLEIWNEETSDLLGFFPNKKAARNRIDQDLTHVFACRNGQVREVAVRYSNEKWSKVYSR